MDSNDSSPVVRAGKQRISALYSRVAPVHEEQGPPRFAHAGRRLVQLTEVAPGERVLDLATGRGAVLFPAAERVGPTGRVVGIDLAEGMVAQTEAAIAHREFQHASVQVMDADSLTFAADEFDRVLCSFAVFFFPDVPRVLAEIRRVLAPGGTVGFAFSRGHDERWRWYEDLLRECGALDRLPPSPGSGAIRQDGALVAELTTAGFAACQEVVEQTDLLVADESTWWTSLWTHGSRAPLDHMDATTLARFKAACLEQARSMMEPAGLRERHTFVYVLAHKPNDGCSQ